MNFQSLVYFKTVAELQHYTKAASTLFITQPALSKAIHNLEVELGVTLFQKEGRNVTLTPSGAVFYEYVKRAVDEINNGMKAVQHRADVERNIIFVSALFSNYTEFLPEKIAQFRKMNPTYRFRIEYKYTSIIVNDVLQGNSELGLCSNLSPDDPVLCSLDRRVIHKERSDLSLAKITPLRTEALFPSKTCVTSALSSTSAASAERTRCCMTCARPMALSQTSQWRHTTTTAS